MGIYITYLGVKKNIFGYLFFVKFIEKEIKTGYIKIIVEYYKK